MNFALGLFHFNPHWGANGWSGRRHCSEALGPFLHALREKPRWRVNIEISGSGLEFVEANFPDQLCLLRSLVETQQVELISSLYTPAIWIAFPHRDLEMSIELNQRCLARLGFPWSRIFFAQEAFFGAGVQTLTEYFDVAVCKDDYLAFYYDLDWQHPHYRLGDMRIVIASGHLVKEVTALLRADKTFLPRRGLSLSHACYLEQTLGINNEANFPACKTAFGNLASYWYHCGDGHHVANFIKPDNLTESYYDPQWNHLVMGVIESIEAQGYQFATIGDFVAATQTAPPHRLPALVEGAWNPRTADGICRWMGRNSTPFEDDSSVLLAISRARRRLLQAEDACLRSGEDAACGEKVAEAWSSLLHAQISDALGWHADAQAVGYAFRAAENALITSTQIIERCNAAVESRELLNVPASTASVSWPEIEIFGGSEEAAYLDVAPTVSIWECVFIAKDRNCGIRLPFLCESITYCPSGAEEIPVEAPLDQFKSDLITLPLSNGLIKVTPEVFLIKDTAFIHVAARISRSARQLEFAVQGSGIKKRFHWRLLLTNTDLGNAVRLANHTNYC